MPYSDLVTRKRQALVAVGCFVGGWVFAAVGAAGYENGVVWLDEAAVYPTGGLWGLSGVFFLRAVLTGRARRWVFPNLDRDADTYGRHHRD